MGEAGGGRGDQAGQAGGVGFLVGEEAGGVFGQFAAQPGGRVLRFFEGGADEGGGLQEPEGRFQWGSSEWRNVSRSVR
ncbi:hypothetical protein SVIO_071990 [Streptomyces violaceusniger]|uniref:Uncharacterized protein n=1 Tax=Streptomyces violaceusniger TaxID=68280 RepID=A0A4D4LBJ6_STRVO|nr:hypothetical protein SVIO_071990 [Streptomyces violaceusniger]